MTQQVADEVEMQRGAVSQLPAEQRGALELANFGGLTQQEISDQLSQPLGTVKARIRPGLLKPEGIPRWPSKSMNDALLESA